MKKLFSIVFSAALATAITASAIPAKRGVLTVNQPDGSKIQVQLIGDESRHCYLTTDNQVLLPNAEGILCYATFDASGMVVPSELKAANVDKRTDADKKFLLGVDATKLRQAVLEPSLLPSNSRRKVVPQGGMGKYTSNFPTKGSIRGLIILVQYKDVKFTTTNPANYFSRMVNERGFSLNGATGSAVDYFIEASNGQFTPQFDVLGPVTLANNQSYYGGNDSFGDDKNPEAMIVEAVKALDPTVDFSVYDNDHDGTLDNVYVFYAGRGEADGGSANTVWPHSWELSSANKSFKVDGVTVDRYACSNEIISYDEYGATTGPDGIGTFVHEFSHVMGLPDLYHTTQTAYYTPCEYSVMDYGPYNNQSRTPPTYSSYERNAMGWIDPVLIDGPMNCSLSELQASNKCYIIQTDKSTEFYLLENRQQTGWDEYIPGHGMLVWHVDFVQSVFDQNIVNNTKSHQYVDLVEANNNTDGSSLSVLAGWPFPGTKYVTEFTDTTKPSMKSWSGASLNLPITGIDETAGVISFIVAGGVPAIEAPEALEATSLTTTSFTANWAAVDGATDYLLSVWTNTPGESGSATADMGSGSATVTLPLGWSSSSKKAYSTNGNYGVAKPSLRLDADAQYLQTAEFDGEVTKLTFWYKLNSGSSSSTASTIDIFGSSNGFNWDKITTMDDLDVDGTEISIDIPGGYNQLRIVYNKDSGNLALDDVKVDYGTVTNIVVPGFNEVSTHGATSMVVSPLVADVVDYRYSVKATKGTEVSRPSNTVFVSIADVPSFLPGDVNHDGKIDVNDLGSLVNMLTGLEILVPEADVNQSGITSSADIGALINILLGM